MILNNKLKKFEEIRKDYFYIDVDSLDRLKLIKIYANIMAHFKEIYQIEEEVDFNDLIRVHYSSSKKGFHIKVNVSNNILENLHFRAIWGDDVYRLQNDLVRLSGNEITYDIIFSTKKKKGLIRSKNSRHICPLKYSGISINDFLLLVAYIKENKLKEADSILNNIKVKDKKVGLDETKLNNMSRLLDKYCKEDENKNLIVINKDNLLNAMYYFSKNN